MLFPVELLRELLERVQYNRQNTHMLSPPDIHG